MKANAFHVSRSKTLRGICIGLAGLVGVHVAHAQSVYQCRAADGQVAYQDHACVGARQQTRIELAAAPPKAQSPDYGSVSREHESKRTSGSHAGTHRAAQVSEAKSYECRADDGEVFYRHSSCPKSIRGTANTRRGRSGRSAQSSESIAVSGVAVSRSEACRRLTVASSAARRGSERDERVSTYEHNLGRDPCRRL